MAAACFMSMMTTSASAETEDPSEGPFTILLLGDSYTAGNGTGFNEDEYPYFDEYDEQDNGGGGYGTGRSRLNYGNFYKQYLESLPGFEVGVTIKNLAEADETAIGTKWQASDIEYMIEEGDIEKVDLVMLSAGGNDINFYDMVQACLKQPHDIAALQSWFSPEAYASWARDYMSTYLFQEPNWSECQQLITEAAGGEVFLVDDNRGHGDTFAVTEASDEEYYFADIEYAMENTEEIFIELEAQGVTEAIVMGYPRLLTECAQREG
ncbi:MAG: hypothetical protein LBL92_03240, partial [Propionibacteriaceae bacterium]|nr:hypothetical protein [Propionibacteriaceae bacterium]